MASPTEIRDVQVILTAGCNLRCSYCYQNDKKAQAMSWDTLRAAADLLLASHEPNRRLLFIGGEPLLEFPLIRRGVEYLEAKRPPGVTVGYGVATNGTLLADDHADFLAAHGFDVQLSFDGVAPAQQLRGRGTFAVLDRLLDRLEAGHRELFKRKLTVAITLVPATIRHLADSIEYFLGKGVGRITISPAITHQPDWREEMIEALSEQFDRMHRASLEHYRRTREVPLQTFRREQQEMSDAPRRLSMCGIGGGSTVTVDANGQVHGCVMFAESYQVLPTAFLRTRLGAMRMGDLRAPELPQRLAAYPAAARAAGIFDDKQDKYSSYGRCGECRFLRECSVCPVSIGHDPANTDPRRVPDFQCAYNLVSLRSRERFPAQPGLRQRILGEDVEVELTNLLGGFRRPATPGVAPNGEGA